MHWSVDLAVEVAVTLVRVNLATEVAVTLVSPLCYKAAVTLVSRLSCRSSSYTGQST